METLSSIKAKSRSRVRVIPTPFTLLGVKLGVSYHFSALDFTM